MGMKVTRGHKLAALLRQGGDRADRRVREIIRRRGKKIERDARAFAPRDHHGVRPGDPPARELERSILMITPRDERNRIQVIVTVGGRIGGVDVDEYAARMHEGDYRLGPESLRKQAAQPGKQVGPKFLERAYATHVSDILDEMEEAVLAELLK